MGVQMCWDGRIACSLYNTNDVHSHLRTTPAGLDNVAYTCQVNIKGAHLGDINPISNGALFANISATNMGNNSNKFYVHFIASKSEWGIERMVQFVLIIADESFSFMAMSNNWWVIHCVIQSYGVMTAISFFVHIPCSQDWKLHEEIMHLFILYRHVPCLSYWSIISRDNSSYAV